MQWGGESFNNAQTMCCEGSRGALRSAYNLSALRRHVRDGLSLAFFRGFRSVRRVSHMGCRVSFRGACVKRGGRS